MNDTDSIPNHHASYPAFSGISGLVAATSMTVGRERDARLAIRLTGLEPGDDLVDIGCGPGAAARRAARLGASVVGVDPAPVMLRVARVLTMRRPVRYVEGTAESLPRPDDSADIVWSIASVHHWKDVDRALSEVRRVLRAGGRFVAIERHTAPDAHGHAAHGWREAQADAFADACRARGFDDVRVEPNVDGPRSTLSVRALAPMSLCSADRLSP